MHSKCWHIVFGLGWAIKLRGVVLMGLEDECGEI